MYRTAFFLIIAAGFFTGPAVAQQAVHVGKGSYAEFPPPSAGNAAAEMVRRTFPLVDRTDRPIPTNKLWTALLEGKAAGSLWMYPWRVDPRDSGLELHLPLQWNRAGSDPLCDAPLRVGGVEFRAAGLQVKDWGDWTLSFRLRQSASRYFDVTVGEGMPIVWVEPHGVELLIDAGRDARCTAPQDGVLVVSAAGRFYAVIAASGTKFTETNGKIAVRMPAGKAFAAFAAMKRPGDLALFARCAGSIPRDSRMDWSYDARRGKVTTTWTVKTEPLVPGGKNVVLQGWLAHHWRDAVSDVEFAGPEYLTPRGTMRTSLGNAFQWVYDFDGFLPSLPAPASRGGAHDFDPRRMEQLLDYCAEEPAIRR